MRIEPFELERWQSLHEHEVEINLSDSGVHPLTARELVQDPGELDGLLDERLVYTQTNGSLELRRRVAELHPGAGVENVQIVNGGAEANFLCLWSLLEPGDEAVVQLPNYGQVPGLVPGLGAELKPWKLRPEFAAGRWVADLEELAAVVGPRTRLIALCQPNNPTGARLPAEQLDAVAAVAARHGAWILCDEIYRGSELDGRDSASLWGRYERLVVTGSLSKSYGLPGLRLGWLVGPAEFVAETWGRHDYTTIGPGALSDRLGRRALDPATRAELVARTRRHLVASYGIARDWLTARPGRFRHLAPEAGAMIFVKHELPISSLELADRMLREQRTLIVPGEHFGHPGWLRLGLGGPGPELSEGLARLAAVVDAL
ncbi:MAG: aminotransferase class I/II-fold pyridoxal phosphate-dependent enzyme [Planctomycetes bacterium]|nr:aminotransferase class I/II-fold pyridoxal phosphate-dependent enzyme [Planctomycetota bacterium]